MEKKYKSTEKCSIYMCNVFPNEVKIPCELLGTWIKHLECSYCFLVNCSNAFVLSRHSQMFPSVFSISSNYELNCMHFPTLKWKPLDWVDKDNNSNYFGQDLIPIIILLSTQSFHKLQSYTNIIWLSLIPFKHVLFHWVLWKGWMCTQTKVYLQY